MARLNEAPSAADPLEILRRKFLRQNRDIARINSTQSLRIRSLENEISRLLAENLGYREQILHLQSEISASQSQLLLDHISGTKAKLESKLKEFNTLVAILGNVPQPKGKPSGGQEPRNTAVPRSPNHREWRNSCALSEEVAVQEGRLPPILENKTYPRQSLDPEDIENVIPDPALDPVDSPDIGSPPTLQFLTDDPVRTDLQIRSRVDHDLSDINPALSVNLEQRRKRKDGVVSGEQRRASRFEPQAQQAGQTLKVGAKRKMSVREDDENHITAKVTEISTDDFKYTLRNPEGKTPTTEPHSLDLSISRASRGVITAKKAPQNKRLTSEFFTSRTALGRKSTNVDIVNSPKKSAKSSVNASLPAKSGIEREVIKDSTRGQPENATNFKTIVKHTVASVDVLPEKGDAVQLAEPGTPSAPDAFSPISSQPSTARANSRDTPPPPDLGPGTEGQRPNRRARASVSYAEPNLRDKMRRPTKDLVDAVTGEGKVQRLSIASQESEAPTSAVQVKGEPAMADSWMNMPTVASANVYAKSPLIDKVAVPDPLSSRLGHGNRSPSSAAAEGERERARSDSGSVVSALIARHRRIKLEPKEDVTRTDIPLHESIANTDIFECGGSPPPLKSSRLPAAIEILEATNRDSGNLPPAPRNTNHEDDDSISDTDGAKTQGSAMSRRRRSTLGLGKSQSDVRPPAKKVEQGMKRQGSSSSSMRSERAAGRRRSMML